MKPSLFVLEGCEAVGKTTQLKLIETALLEKGYAVTVTREPGGTAIGEKIRSILLDPTYAGTIRPLTTLLLFNASRHQWVEEVVKPALERDTIVLSDRSFLTTMVYQGYYEGLETTFVKELCLKAMGEILPQKIFLLDISLEEMQRRLKENASEKQTRYDVMPETFHRKVREGYLAQIEAFPGLIEKINGEASVEAITQEIVGQIVEILGVT